MEDFCTWLLRALGEPGLADTWGAYTAAARSMQETYELGLKQVLVSGHLGQHGLLHVALTQLPCSLQGPGLQS